VSFRPAHHSASEAVPEPASSAGGGSGGRRPGRRVELRILVVVVDLLLQCTGPLRGQGVVAEEEVLHLALVAVLRGEAVPQGRGLAVVVAGFVHVAQTDAVRLVLVVAAERVPEGGRPEGGRLLRRHL